MFKRSMFAVLPPGCCLLALLLVAPDVAARRFGVVLSAGASDDFAAHPQSGCSREHPENCNLYQVVYVTKSTGFHNTGYAQKTRKLTNYGANWAALHPTVSPSGDYAVFDRQELTSTSAPTHALRILDMNASSPTHVHLRSNGRFPHYYVDSTGQDAVVYSSDTTGNVGKLTYVGLSSGSRMSSALWNHSTYLSCPASAVTGGNRVYSDPEIHPIYTDFIVYTDKDDLGNSSGTPAITTYVQNVRYGSVFKVDDSTTNTSNLAHPSFNASGDEIVTGSLAHNPYGFEYDGSTKTWVSSKSGAYSYTKMFATYSAADMAKKVTKQTARQTGTGYGQALLDPALYPEWDSFKVLHSYVQFCGDDDWVVVSVQGARLDNEDADAADMDDPDHKARGDSKSITEAEYSRVYLVDISDRQNPIYYDLILPLEDPDKPYTMEGHGATCYPLGN